MDHTLEDHLRDVMILDKRQGRTLNSLLVSVTLKKTEHRLKKRLFFLNLSFFITTVIPLLKFL